jgi:hypothetical protein
MRDVQVLENMVARDGVEPPMGIEPSEVADSTRDIRGRSDYLDIFPARIQYTDSMKFEELSLNLVSARDGVRGDFVSR